MSATDPSRGPGVPRRFAVARSWMRDLLFELAREPAGIAGFLMLSLFVAGAAFETRLITHPETNARWRDITYWDSQPINAPPAWVNTFSRQKSAVSLLLSPSKSTQETSGSARLLTYVFTYRYDYDIPPEDMVIRFQAGGSVPFAVTLTRPDTQEITLDQEQLSAGSGMILRVS